MPSDPISLPLHIPANALVLDVGSGHRPHARADILCEKYLDDNTERGGNAVIDRPLVLGDILSLPFRDGAFDYIITRHILEHVEDPPAFFREITRVSKAGYIETPSLIWENLHPVRPYHKWVLLKVNDMILMAPKPPHLYHSVLGTVIEELGMNSLEYGLLIKAYLDLFYVRHEWSGTVRYEFYSSPADAPAILREPWQADTARPWLARRGLKDLAGNLIGSITNRVLRTYLIKREQRQLQQRLRRPVDLARLMMCPACHSLQITIQGETARCQDCQWQTLVILPRPTT
jgi:SAM-dependent methyltransferase